MKKIILIFCFAFLTSTSFSQIYLEENFNYPAGDSLVQHGWVYFSGNVSPILVTAPGLTYAGYPLSGIGNATTVAKFGNDNYKSFTSNATSGSVYTSMMVKVDTARTGDYFASYLPSTSTTLYNGRLYAKLTSNGNVAFGISKTTAGSGGIFYGDSTFVVGNTYLIVLKYTFNTITTNDDVVTLYAFSGAIPATEPGTPYVGPVSGTALDLTDLGRFALRQGSSASSPDIQVDGIRTTSSWMPPVYTFKLAIQGLFNSGNGQLNKRDTVNIYVRNGSSPFNVIDSAKSVIDSVTLSGTYVFNNTPAGNYYFEVVYRNSPQFRNGVSTWSKNGGENVTSAGGSYDFTTSASQAYGSNQQLNSGVYTIYNGDVIQDGIVDLSDLITTLNASSSFVSGYVNTDVNGDDQVSLSDVLLVYNNASVFIASVTPL